MFSFRFQPRNNHLTDNLGSNHQLLVDRYYTMLNTTNLFVFSVLETPPVSRDVQLRVDEGKSDYFLDSADRIHFFIEKTAADKVQRSAAVWFLFSLLVFSFILGLYCRWGIFSQRFSISK